MKWKLPPKIKIHEALGAIADGRIEMDGNTAKVYSSSRNKYYTVTFDPDTYSIMANDNGSYWQGYLGYPAIAYLMLVGKLPYTKEQAEAFSGIKWKDINTKFKNDFGKTLAYIQELQKKKGITTEEVEAEIDKIYGDLKEKLPQMLGGKVTPPKEY
ncbi:MAG: hypothetical protein WDZ90_00350 [Candidatus Paceibacterota bacterium]